MPKNPNDMTPEIELPEKLLQVFEGPAGVRGAWGGRGSGKTRSFAKMTAVYALRMAQEGKEGVILCAREYMNSLADSSIAEIKAAIHEEPWMRPHFDIGETYIRTKDGRIEYIFKGLNKNLNSIKSTARIRLCWVDEAEQVTSEAWIKLIPTIREEDAELWVTWNPERKNSATHKWWREGPPDDAKIIELNWRDNPFFPRILEKARQNDLLKRPELYNHIWEGDFATAIAGAYWAAQLNAAKLDGRITNVNLDPLMGIKAFWDIGGTGRKADATSIWIVQWIGKQIMVVDHYTAAHQPLSTHVAWLREKGYDKAMCYLPHDGSSGDKVYDVSHQSYLEDAGFDVEIIPNQGAGAARMRVEAARRHFPKVWFDERRTENGRVSLGWYHEKIDEQRGAGMGPDHDWSSHDADAFGLIFIAYEEPATPMWQKQMAEQAEIDDSWVR